MLDGGKGGKLLGGILDVDHTGDRSIVSLMVLGRGDNLSGGTIGILNLALVLGLAFAALAVANIARVDIGLWVTGKFIKPLFNALLSPKQILVLLLEGSALVLSLLEQITNALQIFAERFVDGLLTGKLLLKILDLVKKIKN